ncbi:MAG: response regulator [Betaproteobacteria bacterium]|nr:response regulator [Betaproteobacteria bacterium]
MSERNEPSERGEDNVPGVSFHEFSAGGETGQLIRGKDWSATSLGPINSWPRSLRNYLSTIQELPTPAIIFWGTDQTQIYNDGYSVIMGPRHQQYLGATFRECWPEAYSTIDPWMQRVLRNAERVEVSKALIPLTRRGFTEESYFTFSFSPLRDDQDAIAGILQIVTDVTDTVLGERRARALHELSKQTVHARTLEDAIELATDVLGQNTGDLPFCLIYLVDALEPHRLVLSGSTGLPEGHAAFPPEIGLGTSGGGIIPEISRVISQREPIAIEGLISRLGSLPGGPWPEAANLAVASPIASADQHSVVGVLISGISPRLTFDTHYRDFVDLVAAQLATVIGVARAYEDEKKRVEAMAQLDRAKTAFFSNVSHEFRTPLTLILGPTEDALSSPEQALSGEPLQMVRRNTFRLMKLVNSLLDFSRIESGRVQASYEPSDLAAMTTYLASAFRSAIEGTGLTFEVACESLPEPIHVDQDMWEKIVLNLLSNALKFTFEGSIGVSVRWCGDHAEFKVRDTGTGIPEKELPHLFERFHRVHGARSRTHEGSGIGLALVHDMVRLHGGTVQVASRPSEGTTFTVSIPRGFAHLPPERIVAKRSTAWTAKGAMPFVEEALRWSSGSKLDAVWLSAATLTPSAARADVRILVVDDNADLRDYIVNLLGEHYAVETAVDGLAALEAARLRKPALVLSDVMMPRLDGFGLLRGLRADPTLRDVPVILLSARAGEESTIEGLEAGADDYLVKPFAARELLARVRTHVELARQREVFERFFTLSLDMMCIAGVDGYFRRVSPAFDALGYSSEELLSRPFLDFVHPDDTAATLAEVEKLAKNVPTIHFENRYRCKDGSYRWLSWSSAPDTSGTMYAIARDVTETKRTQEALARAKDAAEAATRELESFSYSVAHDLRAPLRSIDGFSQALLEDYADKLDADGKKYFSFIRESAQQMAQLIDDLLALSRVTRSELHREGVDLSALARAAITRLQRSQPDRRVDVVIQEGLGGRRRSSAAHGGARQSFRERLEIHREAR